MMVKVETKAQARWIVKEHFHYAKISSVHMDQFPTWEVIYTLPEKSKRRK